MNRIFLSLAMVALLALAANYLLGLAIGDYNAEVHAWRDQVELVRSLELRRVAPDPDELAVARDKKKQLDEQRLEQAKLVRWHWHLGLGAALITILVNSITITYQIGTSRWCKEVVDAYQLPPTLAQESARLKRRTFPWAACSMLSMVVVAALGAASEPGNNLVKLPADWVIIHFSAASLAIALVTVSFIIQATNVHTNYQLIQGVMDQVRKIRSDRGLQDG
ncbi:MAG: hypothetical protein ACKOBW_13190 [Planctomycetota bacterium]